MRIVQIVENLDRQAIESWLVSMLEMARPELEGTEWTFFCILGRPGRMDDRVRALGASVIHSPVPLSETKEFLRFLRQTLRELKPDVLHCHQDVLSGLFLLAALGLDIPKRIVHVHNTSLQLPLSGRVKAAVLGGLLRLVCRWRATHIIGVSVDALNAMIPAAQQKSGRDRVVYCGIDTSRFRPELDRVKLRRMLGVPADALVVLFVGRMADEKNPLFVLDILADLLTREPRAFALFVGKGPLEAITVTAAETLGIGERVRVLGWRDDVPAMLKLADVLLWTGRERWKEGLGLGIVEAQAAGLPVLMSGNVPLDAIIPPAMVEILPLSAGPERWADVVMQMTSSPRPDPVSSLARIESSPFGMRNAARNLRALYDEGG